MYLRTHGIMMEPNSQESMVVNEFSFLSTLNRNMDNRQDEASLDDERVARVAPCRFTPGPCVLG